MATLWLLCVFCLHVLQTSAAVERGCQPKPPESAAPVSSCNFYCRKNEQDDWKIGYYFNGTRCQLDGETPGTCLDMGPEQVGCYPQNSDEVQNFLRSTSNTESTASAPELKKKDKDTKHSNGTSTDKKKKKKKSKKSKNSKKSKKSKKTKSSNKEKKAKTPTTTHQTEPEW
uniref:Putative basic tail protein n=1 Tax=Amblyomma triste TaxID=251400 RepID=A0A023G9V9_AMBTT